MDATQLYRDGKLGEAIDAQIQDVKKHAADNGKRLFLFELCAFSGDLDRAQRQIDAVNYGDPDLDMAVQSYRKMIEGERARRRVFAEGIMPQFLAKPPEWLGKRLEVINCLRGGQLDEADRLFREADELAPTVHGLLNNKPFKTLRDCDDLFGPVLEVIAHGDYYWVPFEQIDSLAMKAPKFPRDLVWLPAKLSVKDGPAGDVFLPVLYPGTHEHPDDAIKLGRSTDWKDSGKGPVLGVGGRLFLVNDDPMSLLEWRELAVVAVSDQNAAEDPTESAE